MSLRADALLGGVHVHEEQGRIAELRYHLCRDARHANVVVERDDATIAGRDRRSMARMHAGE
jgi:hypothetical protein